MNVLAIEQKKIIKKRAIKQAQILMTKKTLVCSNNK
jgi:hypothetical protein